MQLLCPASSIARKSACRSTDSGVVRSAGALHAADHGLHGAKQPAAPAAGFDQGPDHECRRGLAVRAGDPDHLQRLGGIAVEASGGGGHGAARAGDLDLRHTEIKRPLDHERRCARLDGLLRKAVAVGALAGDAEEEGPGLTRLLS